MKTKDVTVQGTRYQLRKMEPVAGSLIFLRMMGVLVMAQAEVRSELEVSEAELPEITDEQKTRMLVTTSIMRGLKLEDVNFAYQHALKCASAEVMVKDTSAWIPVMAADGRWSDPSMPENASLVQDLVIESLVFSLQPFFAASGKISASQNPATTNL